jgi:hypothetical protein
MASVPWMPFLRALRRPGPRREGHGGRRHATALHVAGVALFLLARPSLGAVGEPELPADLPAMLDHAAIVEEMLRTCGHARPDLAASLAAARRGWWERNGRVRETLQTLRAAPEDSHRKAALSRYDSLRRALHEQVEARDDAGDTGYAAGCDDILRELTAGRLDYATSSEKPR